MNFTFENQGTHTYLVYTVGEDDVVDSMSLGMLTNNKIHGVAQALFTQMDTSKYIKYDVSAKISVKQFFTGPVNRKRLIGVFNGIIDAMLSAEDYMIDEKSILLDLDYIFADVSSCETVLICLPIVSDDFSKVDLGAFFKNIMFTTQFDQTENCDYVAHIFNYLNSAPMFSLTEFKNLLETLDGTAPAPVPVQFQQPVMQAPAQTKAPAQPLFARQKSQAQPATQQIPAQQKPQVQPPMQQVPMQQKPAVHPPMQQKPIAPPAANLKMQTPPAQASSVQQGTSEKTISWFYLMQHYNKENAELYKQQKANKKSGQPKMAPAPAPAPAPQQKKQPAPGGFAVPGQNTPANQGFAVPGQTPPANQGFAIPGQNAPVNQGFAIPGQKVPMQQPPVQQPPVQQPPMQQRPPVQQPTYTQPQMPQGRSMNFGETTVLGAASGMGETTVLGAMSATQIKPHLIRTKLNEKIDVNKPVFRIGKEKSYVDYFIGDNPAISRSHANIITREGEYFVVDTNSTNHTYVDGQMIQSNEERKIVHGTKIKLGNEDFEFKLY